MGRRLSFYHGHMQRRRITFALCTCLAGIAATSAVLLSQQRERGPGERSLQREREQQDRERPLRFSVRGTRGAVAAGSEAASEAAMRIFHKGGNAVDAGVASLFAAATFECSHLGIG